MISIEGLSKAEVLKALWDGSKAQGISFLSIIDEMTLEIAEEQIEENINIIGEIYIDYCCGKFIKCDLTFDEFSPWSYDRDNGIGAAKRVIDILRASKK